MRIVIDFQGAQSSGSRNRGIGRYSTSLALAMCKNRGDHEILLALNGAFAKSVDEIRSEFAEVLPSDAIRVFYPLPEVNSLTDARAAQREASEMAWEAFIASLEPDLVHVSSLFEGVSDDAVTSIGAFGFGNHLTAVTLFDLIPLINQERYLSNPVIDRWYRRKIEHISRADLLLSISESSRQEGLTHLNFSQDGIVNISTAADDQFYEKDLDFSEAKTLREKYGIDRPFIMYTGGIDYRKNIEGLIEAYGLLPEKIRNEFALAIVCSCQEADKERLLNLAKQHGLKSGDLIMTGFVPEDDLIGLYRSCKAFVFPSWHEGFGLPALEAMWCGAPVIGSNRSSLPEVIGWDEAMFDPLDCQSIAGKLERVLTDREFADALIKHGAQQRTKFSWEKSARIALEAFEAAFQKRSQNAGHGRPAAKQKPRMAYVSPVPPARSGIADYTAELVPVLAEFYEIDLVVPDDFNIAAIEKGLSRFAANVLPAQRFLAQSSKYDRVLYHFGNSDHHMHMFGLLSEVPGVVVLHDFFLSGILSYWEHHLKGEHVWSRALYDSHGYQALSRRMQTGGMELAVWEYPSNRQVIEQAEGVIVHSGNSRRLAEHWVGRGVAKRFAVIPLLRVAEQSRDRTSARARLGFKPDDILICSFGIMGQTKHVSAVLDGWLASDASNDSRVHLVFVGQRDAGALGEAIDAKIAGSGKGNRIHITGWTDMPEYRDYLRASDIAIQLRTLSRGETSAAVLDCMNYGLPLIINANGAMADIPEDCCIKLDDAFSLDSLVQAIDRLAASKGLREALGKRGRVLIETQHDPATCAALYRDAIEEFASLGKSGPLQLASKIRASLGDRLGDDDCLSLAERLDWNAASVNDDGRVLIDVTAVEAELRKAGAATHSISRLLKGIVSDGAAPRIEPVYWSEAEHRFRYGRQIMLGIIGLSADILDDDVVDFRIGDQLLVLQTEELTSAYRSAVAEIRRRVGLSCLTLVAGPERDCERRLALSPGADIVLEHLRAAGWHPLFHGTN